MKAQAATKSTASIAEDHQPVKKGDSDNVCEAEEPRKNEENCATNEAQEKKKTKTTESHSSNKSRMQSDDNDGNEKEEEKSLGAKKGEDIKSLRVQRKRWKRENRIRRNLELVASLKGESTPGQNSEQPRKRRKQEEKENDPREQGEKRNDKTAEAEPKPTSKRMEENRNQKMKKDEITSKREALSSSNSVVNKNAVASKGEAGKPEQGDERKGKKESTYGPCVGTASMVNDEWQTCYESWEAMSGIMEKFKSQRVWQPFYYDGECAKHLSMLGFTNVVHTQNDFFKQTKDTTFMKDVDVIWDNPPYTSPETKKKVLTTLADTKKPFCMLLPLAVVHAQFVRDLLDMSRVQLVIPRKVYVKKKNQSKVPFKYLVWLCYGLKLPRDTYFI